MRKEDSDASSNSGHGYKPVSELLSSVFMTPAIGLFLFIAILTVLGTQIAKSISSRRSRGGVYDPNWQPPAADRLPFQRRKYFFSAAERSFYEVMRRMIPNHTVFAKVRLADVVYVPKNSSAFRAHQNRIDRKHLDFVICNSDLAPVVAIELDDSSHQQPNRAVRDSTVDQILDAAGLPIVRVRAQRGYQLDALRKVLAPYVKLETA